MPRNEHFFGTFAKRHFQLSPCKGNAATGFRRDFDLGMHCVVFRQFAKRCLWPVATLSRRQIDVNLFGLIETIQAVLPAMRAQRSGVIINVSSVGGSTP